MQLKHKLSKNGVRVPNLVRKQTKSDSHTDLLIVFSSYTNAYLFWACSAVHKNGSIIQVLLSVQHRDFILSFHSNCDALAILWMWSSRKICAVTKSLDLHWTPSRRFPTANAILSSISFHRQKSPPECNIYFLGWQNDGRLIFTGWNIFLVNSGNLQTILISGTPLSCIFSSANRRWLGNSLTGAVFVTIRRWIHIQRSCESWRFFFGRASFNTV